MSALSPEIECRAWTILAQVGLQVIASQLSASPHERHAWARNVEAEVGTDNTFTLGLLTHLAHLQVDRAITKGVRHILTRAVTPIMTPSR
jgi:hypothetical protein